MSVALGRHWVIRWKLNEVMARYRLTNDQLGKQMDRHVTSVSRLRAARKMPRMNGDDLDKLCSVLTGLAGEVVGVDSLIEYVPEDS